MASVRRDRDWTVTLAVFESVSAVVSSPLAIVGEDGVVPTTTTRDRHVNRAF